ncbi:hypothetical protein scyTo_0003625 [Scyliorhinus torazame]|uniref:Uncharacterized protein n=1 Tax=Scyliorhinus torazame TaxID=75743 RepID=A0A401PN09_SCYTO|nr:hypothetical protein [Scyliorhinus torazame]
MQLTWELHPAGGISDGYTEGKACLERQVRKKAEIQHQISQELLQTSNRLHEIEEEQQKPQEGREQPTRNKLQELWSSKNSQIPIIMVTQEMVALGSGQEEQMKD